MGKKLISIYVLVVILYFSCLTVVSHIKEHSKKKNIQVETMKTVEQPQVDFSSYIVELQKQIKSKWNPPKQPASNKVVVRFKIYKNGEISDVRIYTSSQINEVDEEAIKAVEAISPFLPLPEAYKEDSVESEFTFAYNVKSEM